MQHTLLYLFEFSSKTLFDYLNIMQIVMNSLNNTLIIPELLFNRLISTSPKFGHKLNKEFLLGIITSFQKYTYVFDPVLVIVLSIQHFTN